MPLNVPLGKDIFLWNTPLVLGGNPSAIADKLLEGGFQSIILKVADGNRKHYTRVGVRWVEAVTRETVRVLQARGLKVFGYGFNYGIDVVGEGHMAVSQTIALQLDGYVFDVEGSFETRAGAAGARTLGAIFRAGCPNTPAIFCGFAMFRSWTGGTWHNIEVHKAFMEWCDAGMPMTYWEGSTPTAALRLLNESVRQWLTIAQGKPILPAGRAYIGDGGTATAEAMIAFDERAHELGLKGISWWSLEHALRLSPSIWAALRSMPKFGPVSVETPPPAPALTWEQRVDDHELRIAALEAE
jgi:hypothetical protein